MIVQLLGALRQDLMVSVISTAFGEGEREWRRRAFDPDHTVSAAGETGRPDGERRPPTGCPGTVVFWTSGSTGRPKGVVLDPGRPAPWNAVTNARVMGLEPSDRALVILDGRTATRWCTRCSAISRWGARCASPSPRSGCPSLAPTSRARGRHDPRGSAVDAQGAARGFLRSSGRDGAAVRLLTVGGATCPESSWDRPRRCCRGPTSA